LQHFRIERVIRNVLDVIAHGVPCSSVYGLSATEEAVARTKTYASEIFKGWEADRDGITAFLLR
jgi:hypothetical protein